MPFAAPLLPFLPSSFEPSKFRPDQSVCSQPECQRRGGAEYHRRKIETDPEYAEVVRDSRRKWREAHPDYQKRLPAVSSQPRWNATGSFSEGGTGNAGCSFL